jgi:hypothetical protein
MRDSFENRYFGAAYWERCIGILGYRALMGFCNHFSKLRCIRCMKDFGVVEELRQLVSVDARLKREAVFRAAFQGILGGFAH